ncbi:hypothetical protein NHQ30_001940 [Ciborinia camelliae]|nr:hypothetical protein NHQ30_001940 [Ciborinia camelliae]
MHFSMPWVKSPLIITGYSGRNHACPAELVKLADLIPGLRVLDTGGCDMCFPASHPAYLGFRLSFDKSTTEADMIFVLDCDVPWIPSRNRPREDALIYHVDVDPLNATMGLPFFPAQGRWKADSYTALTQINQYLTASSLLKEKLSNGDFAQRHVVVAKKHQERLAWIAKLATPHPDGSLDIHHVGATIKSAVPPNTVFVVEAATCAMPLQVPGS